jgi:hypothetical protein
MSSNRVIRTICILNTYDDILKLGIKNVLDELQQHLVYNQFELDQRLGFFRSSLKVVFNASK